MSIYCSPACRRSALRRTYPPIRGKSSHGHGSSVPLVCAAQTITYFDYSHRLPRSTAQRSTLGWLCGVEIAWSSLSFSQAEKFRLDAVAVFTRFVWHWQDQTNSDALKVPMRNGLVTLQLMSQEQVDCTCANAKKTAHTSVDIKIDKTPIKHAALEKADFVDKPAAPVVVSPTIMMTPSTKYDCRLYIVI